MEWIVIDRLRLPFITVTCCKPWLVCSAYRWGRCGLCGEAPR